MSDVAAPPPLAYATPARPAGRAVWPLVVLSVLALGLVGLSGCFLMGVGIAFDLLGPASMHPVQWSGGRYAYVAVLFAFAAGSFAGGMVVTTIAVRLTVAAARTG